MTRDEKIIKNTRNFVKKLLLDEPTGHDWWHALRVSNNARNINQVEKGNWLVIELASLLHDVGDRKVIKQQQDDYSIAENFLKTEGLSTNLIDEVMYIIKNMSFSKSLDSKKIIKNRELMIVQDADRLDALGAIGIARTFAYGGSVNQVIYNPDLKPLKKMSATTYKNHTTTSYNHLEEKLFLLSKMINTETAKEIAKDREKFMKHYTKRFLEEWNGLK